MAAEAPKALAECPEDGTRFEPAYVVVGQNLYREVQMARGQGGTRLLMVCPTCGAVRALPKQNPLTKGWLKPTQPPAPAPTVAKKGGAR